MRLGGTVVVAVREDAFVEVGMHSSLEKTSAGSLG